MATLKSDIRSLVPLFAVFPLLLWTIASAGQEKPGPAWNAHDFQFRVLNTNSSSGSLWICGTDEAIAVSSDDGRNWDVKHHIPDGNSLLNIDFVNEGFGYATGTGGIFLTTEDGGKTWLSRSVAKDTILQASFSDSQHGIIRTPSSLLFTADGGQHFSVVSDGQNADYIKQFPYTFALVALDPAHMGIMMKEGSAQYEGQRFLVSSDSGKTWKITLIPDSTIYSFLRVGGQYWAVGTQVIGKDKGGGHAVAAAFYSADGEKWIHANSDVSACQLQMCVACKKEGCFSSNGLITNVFLEKTTYSEFPPNAALTSKWSRSNSTICFVGSNLQCAGLKQVDQAKNQEGLPGPVAVSPGPLGATTTTGPQCILCQMDRIVIDKGGPQGGFTIKLTITIAKNGTVTNVESDGAPTPEIKSRIEQQAQQWLFEPYLKNGERVSVRLTAAVRINVIKPR